MPQKAKATLLVVDDEAEVRKLLCAMASQLSYDVLAAASGPRALALHKLFRPIDLLIADVVMPGMSGPALAERMSALQPGLKVLYISGFMRSRVVQKYVIEPGLPLLAKPFSFDDFESRVREILQPSVKVTGK
jgi:CheY-like chemotaxis protein